MTNSLIDAGPLIALFDKDDTYNKPVIDFLKQYSGRLFTTWPVITEVSHMLNFNINVQTDFLKWLNKRILSIIDINNNGLLRIIELISKYSNVPMDLADGSLLWLSEQYKIKNIVTIDSDYYIYRTKNKEMLENLLEPFIK